MTDARIPDGAPEGDADVGDRIDPRDVRPSMIVRGRWLFGPYQVVNTHRGMWSACMAPARDPEGFPDGELENFRTMREAIAFCRDEMLFEAGLADDGARPGGDAVLSRPEPDTENA